MPRVVPGLFGLGVNRHNLFFCNQLRRLHGIPGSVAVARGEVQVLQIDGNLMRFHDLSSVKRRA